ncbi:rRNA-processing protein [Martiniozyma asiatica (nom. inval.)]|nr:rRNA-processing protein [Martiniozyma asiatica]
MSKRTNDGSESELPRKKSLKPSSHDIQVARETAELFKSNIFKLQIDELLKELKLKESHCKLVEKVLHKLHSIIQKIPNSKEMSLDEATKFFENKKTTIPFPDPKPQNINYKLQYTSPDDINLVGSFGLKSGIQQKEGMSIDVCLTMDKSLVQQKDYLNYRILYKRAFYIAYLAEYLEKLSAKENLPISIVYDFHNGDVLCPTLLIKSVTPKEANDNNLIFNHTNFSIRILIASPHGAFDAKKLLPDRNCIRIKTENDNEIESNVDLPPTPLYNASVLSSSTYIYYLKYLYTTKRSAESFRDAASLAKLWLNQRNLSSHIEKGGFGHFEFTTLMAALLEGGGESSNRILMHGYSSYQLFKGTIRYLATQDLCDEGYLSFSSIIGDSKSTYKKPGFGVPTMFDKNTKINIFWKMTPSSYELLKKYAIETLELLNDVIQDKFQQIFIKSNTNAFTKYDAVVSIPYSSLFEHFENELTPVKKISFITLQKFIKAKLYSILSKALDGRVTHYDIRISKINDSFTLNKRKPMALNKLSNVYINIGLFFDSLESEKRVTKGPLHSDKDQGEIFSSFWGEKAQLRRYKDGTVQWSCIWDLPSPINGEPTESPVITIIKYILDLHLNYPISEELSTAATKFSSILPNPIVPFSSTSQPIVLPSQYLQLKSSFENLVSTLQRLELPVSIRNCIPISSSMRNTSVLLPMPFASTSPDFWNDCILQFDNSANSKWPTELNALEATKSAFLLKIRALLNEEIDGNGDGYKSFIIDDKSTIPYVSKVRLLRIITPEGYGFQLRVVADFEENIYLSMIEAADSTEKKIVEDVYLSFHKNTISSIKHHRTINTLVTSFPLYSATVRLFKIWLDKHLLLVHLNEQIIELLVLKVFVDVGPYGVPGTVMAGFLRTIEFLSHWNWRDDPLILDIARDFTNVSETETNISQLSEKFSVSQYQSIVGNFEKIRRFDPKGSKICWFVATKDDPSGKIWSNNISLVTVNRIMSLSRVIMTIFNTKKNDVGNVDVENNVLKTVFTAALKDFDYVIHLKKPIKDNEKRKNAGVLPMEVKYKNLLSPSTSIKQSGHDQFGCVAGVDSDVILNIYKDITSKFEGIIWYIEKYNGLIGFEGDKIKDRIIAGLVIPGNEGKKFKVGMPWIMKPINSQNVSIDLDDIIESVKLLGGELVKNIEMKK